MLSMHREHIYELNHKRLGNVLRLCAHSIFFLCTSKRKQTIYRRRRTEYVWIQKGHTHTHAHRQEISA